MVKLEISTVGWDLQRKAVPSSLSKGTASPEGSCNDFVLANRMNSDKQIPWGSTLGFVHTSYAADTALCR